MLRSGLTKIKTVSKAQPLLDLELSAIFFADNQSWAKKMLFELIALLN